MSEKSVGLLVVLLASSYTNALGKHEKDSACSKQLFERFVELERKFDLLLGKLCAGDQDSGIPCGGQRTPTVTPKPTEGSLSNVLPTAYPDKTTPPPVSIKSRILKMEVLQGYEARLPCTTELFKDEVEWYLFSDLIAIGYYAYSLDLRIGVTRTGPNLWYLNIASVSAKDQGVYSCVTGGKTTQVVLTVVDPLIQMGTAKLGSQLSVQCPLVLPEHKKEKLRVVWTDPQDHEIEASDETGKLTKSRVTVNSDTTNLDFTHVTPGDGGNYTCSIEGSHGPRAIYQLSVDEKMMPPTFRLTLAFDAIETSPETSVMIGCFAEGKPCPTIEWKHNQEHSKEKSWCVGTAGSSALILNNLTSPQTVVTCVARNRYGQIEKDTILRLTGKGPAIILPPRDVAAIQGQVAIFNCRAFGTPEPEIRWVMREPDSEEISENPNLYEVHALKNGDSVLVVDLVKHEMNGSTFTCVAETSTRTVNFTATLLVCRKGEEPFACPDIALAADSLTWPAGRPIVARCSGMNGQGCESFRWYKNDVQLDTTDRRVSVSEEKCLSVMVIANAEPGDAARYRCSGQNENGVGYSNQLTITVT